MSSRPAKWICSLEPLAQLPECKIPNTLFPFLQSESKEEDILFQDSRPVNVAHFRGIDKHSDLENLIAGYSRWIMAVTGLDHIAFMMTECEEEDLKSVILSVLRKGDGLLEWQAYEISLEASGLPVEITRVTLCVDLQPPALLLTYRAKRMEQDHLSDLAEQIEKAINSEKDSKNAVYIWESELSDFVGLSQLQFPTLSCTRPVKQAASPTFSFSRTSLLLQASWEQIDGMAQQFDLESGVSVIRAAFAYTLAEYMETGRLILGDQDLADLRRENPISPVPVFISPEDTSKDLLCRIDNFKQKTSQLPCPSLEMLRNILKCPPSQVPYHALFTYCQDVVTESGPQALQDTPGPSLEIPVQLSLQRTDGGNPVCTLSSSSDLLDSSHSELVMKQIDALVIAMCSAPTEPIRDLTQSFNKDILSVHSPVVSTDVQNAPLLSPVHWVDHWASSNPSWVGLEIIDSIDEENAITRKWTYQDLSQTSDQLCAWLLDRGWANMSIAVCLDRSFAAYCLVLAIWKSGNCYVPIAEDLPEARQLFFLSDSGAIAFFIDKQVAKSLLSPENCEVIDIESVMEICLNSDVGNESERSESSIGVGTPKPSDNSYLLYTSGSTGKPKGVLVSRGNLSAFTEAQSEYICRDVPDTTRLKGIGSYLAHASRAFDVHICEMVLGWRHGLRLVTGQRSMLLDNLYLVLTKLKITHAGFVPSLLEHAGVSAESLPCLRYLGVGGEKISETIIERFVGKQSISLVNAYGPTEATIGFTSHTVKPWSTVRNIGTAVGNITVHVLEPETNNYVKRGQAGELCVTGDLVANGYHRRPDAKGFTDHHGERMYRTGDIVRLMANNCIEYLGRRDSQAKIRGQRLELEEVSVAIRRCAEFPVNVTSMVTPSPITKRPQLVSFVSPSGDRSEISDKEVIFLKERYQEWIPKILEKCRVELPAYMVPSVLVPVSFIPVQISGKGDNRRLVSLYESIPTSDLLLRPVSDTLVSSGSGSDEDEGELTPDEIQVRDILCSLVATNHNSVKRSTSIFQLGIDSLGSLSVASKLRSVGFICSAVDVLHKATIQKLALLPRSKKELDQMHGNGITGDQESEASQILSQLDQNFRSSQTKIPNSSIAVVRPCLPLQESIVSNSLGSSTPLYVNHIMCRLGKGIKLANLKSAFEDLMQHNEILRTCFQLMDKTILQVVLKPRAVTLRWEEVVVSDENVARGVFNTSQARIATGIIQNIDQVPPFHILAASSICEDDSGWLMLSIHHSIFDGASMGLFLKQLHHHYSGSTATATLDLSPLYQYMIKHSAKSSEIFWSSYLSGHLPGIVDDGDHDGSYSILTKTLPFKLSSLSKVASEASSTTPIVVETAWAIALTQCLGQKDVIFGRVMNGRSIPVEWVEEMLLPLITTVPGRFRLPVTTSSLLREAKSHTRAVLESLPYQHTPLRKIQRYNRLSGPLFNSLISYIATGPRSPGDDILSEMESDMPADYPLALEVKAESETDTLTLRLRLATVLSSEKRYVSLIDKVFDSLKMLVSHGDVIIDAAGPFESQEKENPDWDETKWTETENKIRRAVTQVSGLSESQVSKNASFFALGIDSILSIHVARYLQTEGVHASPSDILRYPSIGALNNHLQTPRAAPLMAEGFQKSSDLDIGAESLHSDDSVVESYPCTPLQTAMIGQCLSSGGKGYLHHHAVTLNNSIDLEKLVAAWQVTVENVDILRTSFHRHNTNNQFYGAVHQSLPVQWSHQTNIASLPKAIEAISQKACYANAEDFHRPPWYVTFLTGPSQQLMVVTMHHCLYDGFSLPLLFKSLEENYHGDSGSMNPFAPVARTISARQKPSLEFWSNVVANYQYSGLQPPSASTLPNIRWAKIKIQTPVAELKRQCGSMDITLQTVALFAFGCSLMPLLGQRDIVFGHVVSGRSFDIDSSMNVIGPLFNTVPFRLKVESAQQSIRSTLKAIQRFSIDSQPYQHAPLSLIQRDWRMANGGYSSSLFEALFTFNKSTSFGSESIFRPYEASHPREVPQYRLNVEFDLSEDSLVIRTVSNDFLTGNNDLENWVQNLALGIENALSSCDSPVFDLPLAISDLPLVKTTQPKLDEQFANDAVLENNMEGLRLILSRVTETALEDIDSGDSVFALGLDSILALDVSSQCRKAGLKVSVSEILQGQTIRGIAKLASDKVATVPSAGAGTGTAGSNPVEYSAVDSKSRSKAISQFSLSEDQVEAVIPCLSGQIFYLASWLHSERKIWEFTFPLKSKIRIDPEKLQLTWKQLQQRHSILRTVFTVVDSKQILQVVKSSSEVDLSPVHIQQASEDLQISIPKLIQHIGRESSDLFTPPIRLHLIQHDEGDIVLLTLHHSLYDARTMSLLLHDFEALYQNLNLSPPPSFTSFVLDIQQKYYSGYADEYWKESLQMSQPTIIGSDITLSDTLMSIESSQIVLSQNPHDLEQQCRQKSISMPSLMLLAVARSLARFTNTSHPTFGLFQNGRSNECPDIDHLVGPTINMLPLVVQDALVSPSKEKLVAMQQNLAQRALYDQTDLGNLCEKMRVFGQEIKFNFIVNILWGQVNDKDKSSKEVDTMFTPLSLDSNISIDSGKSCTGKTAIDELDWKNFPGAGSIYLEVGYDAINKAILLRLDYASNSLLREEADSFLHGLQSDVDIILGHI
ncbi:hypothetical protein PENSTE_c013G03355 [Penicillium steckii]|uniref:Carrier domain-containing protein n=1 Tax=Penicillium steckii TaxID=303698 RepID=A0A1V6T2U6_9EURO|nr:hypothetical protein PENSTE_c013G03355 [Penicillium steckii]